MLKVDADKLPQAEAIRSRLFLTTVSVDVSDQEIRLVTRKAFPNLFNWAVFGISATLSAQMQVQQAGNAGQAPAAGAPAAGPGAGGSSQQAARRGDAQSGRRWAARRSGARLIAMIAPGSAR